MAAITAQAELVGARGVALFACAPLGLRLVLPLLKVELAPACPYCGGPATQTELGEAAVRRVLTAKADVIDVPEHAGLAQHDGLAASLRYAL